MNNDEKLIEPPSTDKNRDILAEIIVNDMSKKELHMKVKMQLIDSFAFSRRNFIKEYRKYYKETGGHCPFGINSE